MNYSTFNPLSSLSNQWNQCITCIYRSSSPSVNDFRTTCSLSLIHLSNQPPISLFLYQRETFSFPRRVPPCKKPWSVATCMETRHAKGPIVEICCKTHPSLSLSRELESIATPTVGGWLLRDQPAHSIPTPRGSSHRASSIAFSSSRRHPLSLATPDEPIFLVNNLRVPRTLAT